MIPRRAGQTGPHDLDQPVGVARRSAAEGFGTLELMGTLAGRPLYEAAGFTVVEHVTETAGGVGVPLVRMRKHLP